MKKKVFLKDNFRLKYNRAYVNKLSNKRLSFSKSSYVDTFREYSIITINKKIVNKIIRKLNKFIGKRFSDAIEFLENSFVKREDFKTFVRYFFVQPDDVYVNHQYYCDNNGLLAYHNSQRNKDEEIKFFTKEQLSFNSKVNINTVGKVYIKEDGLFKETSDYFKIKYIGKFYVYIDGHVELKKVYHVPFFRNNCYSTRYICNNNGVYSKIDNEDDVFLQYRKGTVEYQRFMIVRKFLTPVKIYTNKGEIEYVSHYYEREDYIDEETGEKKYKINDLGFGVLNLAIFKKNNIN